MLASIILGLQGLPANELKREIAYVIRRYKPGKARSRFQIEICQVNGERLRRLSVPSEPGRVMWRDRGHLVWDDGSTIFETTLRGGKTRRLATGILDSEVVRLAFGKPSFTNWNEDRARSYLVGDRVRQAPFSWFYDFPEDGNLQFIGSKGEPRELDGEADDSAVNKSIRGLLNFVSSKVLNGHKGAWIATDSSMVGGRTLLGLTYEEISGKQRLLLSEAGSFSGDPYGSVLTSTTRSNTRKLGSLRVFMNELVVMNWRTGKSRLLRSGDILVTSVSMRPLK